MLLQALNGSGQAILQAVPLVLSYILPFLSTTPRDIYLNKGKCPTINLGTLIPSHTVIFVLGLEYSTIAPLILPFVCLFFYLSYFVYLYQFLYQYEMEYESGGLAFPRAIRHVYIGLFTWQLTMIGLFAIQQTVAEMILMIITLVLSICALALYDKSFEPLFNYLPVQPQDDGKTVAAAVENNSIFSGSNTAEEEDDKRVLTHIDQDQDTEEGLRRRKIADSPDKILRRQSVGLADAYVARAQLKKRMDEEQEHSSDGHLSHEITVSSARLMFEVESYMHPSIRQAQPTVWLPKDDLGITDYEMEQLKKFHVRTSDYGAYADHAGKKGQKSRVRVDDEMIVNGGKGVPGEMPANDPNFDEADYVRHVLDSYAVVESLALTL